MTTIRLNASDSSFERARKLIEIAGFIDRVGIADRIAEPLEKYRELDLNNAKNEQVEKMRNAIVLALECLAGLEGEVSGNNALFLQLAQKQLEPFVAE